MACLVSIFNRELQQRSGSRFVQFEVPFLSSALGDTEASDMRSSSWSGDPDDVETGSFELPDSGNPELFLYSG